MKTRTIASALFLVCPTITLLGCSSGQPPEVAEENVRKATRETIWKLDGAELNRLFKLKAENGALPYGRIYAVAGTVKLVSIQEKKEKEPSEWVYLNLIVPDYAAATIECRFAMARKDLVVGFKQGQTLAIRGKLDDRYQFSDSKLTLTGCIVADPEPGTQK